MVAQRTGLRSNLRASKWERWLHLEGLGNVRRERLAETVHLCLHLRHWEGGAAGFQDTHVPNKELPRITVNVGVWARNSDLIC